MIAILRGVLCKYEEIGKRSLAEISLFHEVINDTQRKTQVRLKNVLTVHKTRGTVQKKTFTFILGKFCPAKGQGGRRNVQSDVLRILCKRQLISIAASKLNDRADFLFHNKVIKNSRFEISKLPVRARARVASQRIPGFPEILRPRKQDLFQFDLEKSWQGIQVTQL